MREVQAIDKGQPIYDIKSMRGYFAESIAKPRLYVFILSLFAATAFLLSVAGIYGAMSYTVSQRVNEIGIRMAVGAETSDIIRLVLGQGLVLVGIGLAIGISSALVLTRLMVSLLYDVKATDPWIFVALSVFLAAVAGLASYFPARRDTKIDPMLVLRDISN